MPILFVMDIPTKWEEFRIQCPEIPGRGMGPPRSASNEGRAKG